MNIRSAALVASLVLATATGAYANPVDVSVTTSGSSGNWTYDFAVTDNLGGSNNVYFFGVSAPSANNTASPSGWNNWGGTWSAADSSSYGGPAIDFNDTWITWSSAWVTPGNTLSGFEITSSDAIAQTSFSWYAFAYGGNYTGGDNYNNSGNPGFSGTAGASVATEAPEPVSMALIGSGLVGLGLVRRRKAA